MKYAFEILVIVELDSTHVSRYVVVLPSRQIYHMDSAYKMFLDKKLVRSMYVMKNYEHFC